MANAVVGRVLLIPKGNYSASVSYSMLDIVRYDNKSWVCKQACTGQTPAISIYWDIWCEDGTDGADGTNTYTYIRYSASADGTGFVDTPTTSTIYIGFYAGTSATAPTDKTAYTWSKYVGESGSGIGDMLKSEFATNGTTGVVDTSNRLRKYVTTKSDTAYINQWTKIATVTFNGAYQSENVIFSVINRDTSLGMGVFSARVSVGATASTHASADFNCISADKNFKLRVGTIKIVYTAPVYELWFNPTDAYSILNISILNETHNIVGFTWLDRQPYQATQPAGTVVTATLVEDYLITDLTAETAIADADYFPYYDTSAVANRKTLWSNIKSVLKAYFDTLYNNYVLPKATTSTLGGIKPDGTTITVNEDGVASSAGASGTILDSGTAIKNNTTADQICGALGAKELFNEVDSGLKAKALWTGTFTSGSITVSNLSDYAVILVTVGGAPCIGTREYGSCGVIAYGGYTVSQYAYRLSYSDNKLTINDTCKGGSDGTLQKAITSIFGLIRA